MNDKKCGFGIYKWSGGWMYKGNFLDNYMHGEGILKFKDGRTIRAEWNMGKIITDENESIETFPD